MRLKIERKHMAALYVIVHHHLSEYDRVMNTAMIPKSGKLAAALKFTTPLFLELFNAFVTEHHIPSPIKHAIEAERLARKLEDAGLLFHEQQLAGLLGREPQRGDPLTPTLAGESFYRLHLERYTPERWPLSVVVDTAAADYTTQAT